MQYFMSKVVYRLQISNAVNVVIVFRVQLLRTRADTGNYLRVL